MENQNKEQKMSNLLSKMKEIRSNREKTGEDILYQLSSKNLGDEEINLMMEIFKQLEEQDKPKWIKIGTTEQIGVSDENHLKREVEGLNTKPFKWIQDCKIENNKIYFAVKPSDMELMKTAMEDTGIDAEEINPDSKEE